MQRRQRHQRRQSVEHAAIDAYGPGVALCPVDDAMTDRSKISIPHVRLQPIEEELQSTGMLRRAFSSHACSPMVASLASFA